MRRVGMIVYPDFQVLCFAAFSVFEVANREAGKRLYDLEVLGNGGGAVRSSFGQDVTCAPLVDTGFDTMLVGVGIDVPDHDPAVSEFLVDTSARTRRIASICLGSFVLGDAGLLDGHKATTHWNFGDRMRARFPRCTVDLDRIYVQSGRIWSSAGMSAGIDLALGLVEEDHGRELTAMIAKGMVLHHRRAPGQSQHSTLLDIDARSDRIQASLAHARRNLRNELSVAELAAIAHLSPRHFARAFRAETGRTPAQAVAALRMEQARMLIAQGTLSMETIARDTGFGDTERMRRAFVRGQGTAPTELRRRLRMDRETEGE
ncbi:transcriptional regulator, AraC family with amidase-like domain [Luteibacter sp. 22Crub2.1]|nr:Transcriptional regulator GlxA family, contains an amidase domain and an AraC-type DNA-binding HTH domain [Dyella sp. 333MFSha]SKB27546.1 transcriptional regulator, AraC family with amidase-like domain [Luteibacter sp. 22Crub2.1]